MFPVVLVLVADTRERVESEEKSVISCSAAGDCVAGIVEPLWEGRWAAERVGREERWYAGVLVTIQKAGVKAADDVPCSWQGVRDGWWPCG